MEALGSMRILFLGCCLGAILTMPAVGDVIGDPQAAELAPSVPGGGGPPISHIGGLTFTFVSATGTSPSQSSCIIGGVNDDPCDFVNVSGQTWQQLTISANPGSLGTSCAILDPFFANCSVTQGSSSIPSTITFFGGPGISTSEAFSLAVVGWAPNTVFDVSATVATPGMGSSPEPRTMFTALAGLGICLLTSRIRQSRHS